MSDTAIKALIVSELPDRGGNAEGIKALALRGVLDDMVDYTTTTVATLETQVDGILTTPTTRASIRPSLLLDFANSDVLDPRITYTRNDANKTYFDRNGILRVAKANEWPREFDTTTGRCLGRSVWESRTNVALWSRDLTNAAWVKSNTTAALTQIGVDGVANSASLLTATAANGTALQTVTLASSARFQTAYVRRVTGTGTINMTTDGGATWTAVTLTSTWTRVSIPTQTLANPQFGFRIVTSGDAIAVDYVQNENGVFASPAIPTSTVSVTRAAELAYITGTNFTDFYNQSEGSIVATGRAAAGQKLSGNSRLFGVSDNTALSYMGFFWSGVGSNTSALQVQRANVAQAAFLLTSTDNSNLIDPLENISIALSYKENDFAGVRDGHTVFTDTSGIPPTCTHLFIGGLTTTAGAFEWNGTVSSLAYYSKRLTNTEIQALTTTGLLAGKSPNQLPAGTDLGSAAYTSAQALLTARSRQEFQSEGTGASRSITIRRPYDFYFSIVDATGSTVSASPSTSALSLANTNYTLTFNAPTGTILSYAITPVIQ